MAILRITYRNYAQTKEQRTKKKKKDKIKQVTSNFTLALGSRICKIYFDIRCSLVKYLQTVLVLLQSYSKAFW